MDRVLALKISWAKRRGSVEEEEFALKVMSRLAPFAYWVILYVIKIPSHGGNRMNGKSEGFSLKSDVERLLLLPNFVDGSS